MSKLGMKRPERVVELCTNLDLQAEHDRASAALEDARAGKGQMLVDANLADAQKRVQEIETAMLDHVLEFTIRALPRKRWVELENAHPPRKDDDVDAHYRVNMSTFVDAVLAESITSVAHKSNGEAVEFNAAEDWADEADEMTSAQWEAFALATLALNRGTVAPGFNKLAWRKTPSSASN